MILVVKAKYVDPSQMDLFGGEAPLQQKKTWVRHPKTGKMFQKTVYVRTDKNDAIGRQIGKEHSVLQVPGSKMAAIPATGRKSSAKFVVMDTETREEVVNPIGKDEVRLWLIRHAESEGLPKHEEKPEPVKPDIVMAPGVSEDDIPYDLARQAYYFSSMDPDRRARVERAEYVGLMNQDYTDLKEIAEKSETTDILDEEFDRYRKGYVEKVKAYLSANSRTASSMVTGSANFPVERNRRRMEAANRRMQETEDFRKKALNAIKRKLQPEKAPIRSGEADAGERLSAKLANLQKLQETMKAANKVVRSKGSDADKIRRLQEVGLTEDQAKEALIPDYMGRQGFPEFALRNNNAEIKRVKDRLDQEKKREAVAAATSGEDRVKRFDGGEVELDYDDNRIRIRHDEKPSADVRSQLKSRGFRWSPKNGAWQRQLTDNAKRVTSQITGVEL